MHRHPDLPKAFAELGLEVPALRAVSALGFKEPSPIQRELIPLILAGKDVIGQARTGTGKTAAFGLPTLQMIDPAGRTQMLVLAPTRELAVQVIGEFHRLTQFMEVRCVPVYGGTKIRQQLAQLGSRPHVVVGTPGRVMDVLARRALSLEAVRFVVLDEVDRMLDIGFRDDIRRILSQATHPHQTVFVSATIEDEIKRLAQQYMRSPVEINVSGDQLTVNEVSQYYCSVDPADKFRLLMQLLEQEQPSLAIVFCNTKHAVRKLAKRLHAAGIDAKEIHGDLIQERRERIMTRFRKQQIPVLVATDLAARGIDVRQISHIVNYDLPQDPQAYVHRIGRTARMGATGKAITFVSMDEGGQLTEVEKLINKEVQMLTIGDFRPRPASPAPVSVSSPAPSVAAPASAAAVAESPSVPAATRTLGGKFPIRRRGRRH
jgi:ATP-dependent RNA helicase DeaD